MPRDKVAATEYKRQYRIMLRSTEEGREKLRAWERAAYAKRVSTPEGRIREARKSRVFYARKLQTEEGRAWLRAKWQAKWARRVARRDIRTEPYINAVFNDKLYARIHKLVPFGPNQDDIISEVYLRVLEGTFPDVITATHVKEATKFLNKDSYKMVSLNAPRGDTTLGQLMGVY